MILEVSLIYELEAEVDVSADPVVTD